MKASAIVRRVSSHNAPFTVQTGDSAEAADQKFQYYPFTED
jgi:hypothetical protein